MNTHNNIINGLPVLRIWHSFDAEELQNIDGKGTDLFPLPNIKGLQTEEGKVNLPYMDILLRDSRITPQILVYSGELSEQQEELFESLHYAAKNILGQLFIISYNEIENKLTYGSLIEQVCQFVSYASNLSLAENAYSRIKATFIDLQRLAILYDSYNIFNFLENKYQVKFSAREMLYADFDRLIQPILKLVDNISNRKDILGGILMPVNVDPHPFSLEEVKSKGRFGVKIENNFIYSLKNNSVFIKEIIEKLSQDLTELFSTSCYGYMGEVLLEPISMILPKDIVLGRQECTLAVGVSTFKKDSELTEILNIVMAKIGKFGILVEQQELEPKKDLTWQKEIHTLILDDYYKKTKVSSKLEDLAKLESQETTKSPGSL